MPRAISTAQPLRVARSGLGTVFEIDTSNNFSVLHNFAGGASDGSTPYGGLVIDASGNLFGTTSLGGSTASGTIFEINSAASFSVLYSFTGGSDGANPKAGLTIDPSGNLYGAASGGGSGNGTIFKFSTTTGFSLLHSFAGGADGSTPYAGSGHRRLPGNLYGTTYYGGSGSEGTVFRIDSLGNFSAVYSFTDGAGINPGGLTIDAANNLYGVTDQWRCLVEWNRLQVLAQRCHRFAGNAHRPERQHGQLYLDAGEWGDFLSAMAGIHSWSS